MALPINDKMMPPVGTKASRSDDKGTGRPEGTGQSTEGASPAPQASQTADDRVNINQANQVLNQSNSQGVRSENPIESPEQAASLAAQIKEQIQAQGAKALTAQGGVVRGHLDALLNSAPA
ncbi:hypothetical protein ACFL0R_00645 [Pseudomonadota bacterium]